MNQRYPKKFRLRKRSDFQKMARSAKRHVASSIVVDSRENGQSFTRLGITVTRQFGDSHERNRFKRIVREAFRLCYTQLPVGIDLNVRPRSAAKTASRDHILADLKTYYL